MIKIKKKKRRIDLIIEKINYNIAIQITISYACCYDSLIFFRKIKDKTSTTAVESILMHIDMYVAMLWYLRFFF